MSGFFRLTLGQMCRSESVPNLAVAIKVVRGVARTVSEPGKTQKLFTRYSGSTGPTQFSRGMLNYRKEKDMCF